jgi:hypothetical protein
VIGLAARGVDISLVRFQPYQHAEGHIFVTFSQMFPLPDLEKSIVGPGTPAAEMRTNQLPPVPWTVADLVALGQ